MLEQRPYAIAQNHAGLASCRQPAVPGGDPGQRKTAIVEPQHDRPGEIPIAPPTHVPVAPGCFLGVTAGMAGVPFDQVAGFSAR